MGDSNLDEVWPQTARIRSGSRGRSNRRIYRLEIWAMAGESIIAWIEGEGCRWCLLWWCWWCWCWSTGDIGWWERRECAKELSFRVQEVDKHGILRWWCGLSPCVSTNEVDINKGTFLPNCNDALLLMFVSMCVVFLAWTTPVVVVSPSQLK